MPVRKILPVPARQREEEGGEGKKLPSAIRKKKKKKKLSISYRGQPRKEKRKKILLTIPVGPYRRGKGFSLSKKEEGRVVGTPRRHQDLPKVLSDMQKGKHGKGVLYIR